MNKQRPNPFQSLWDFFCSLKLAIFTLIMLAVTSIIGTVIQQGLPQEEYLRIYGETKYRLYQSLDLFDMYHSWWFLALLSLFALNLTCCSIKRLPRIWKTVREPVLTPQDSFYRTLANADEQTVKLSAEEARSRLVQSVGRLFAKPVVNEADGKIHLYAQKMAWARFGVYVTHLSILIIFVGAMIGNLAGFKAYVNIPEGSSVSKVWPRTQGAAPIELGFEVRCDRFQVDFYPGTQRPKEFVSDLVVIDGGQEVVSKTIEVNDPLSYKGLTFYQASYGAMGDPTFRLQVKNRESGETRELNVRLGDHVPLPDGSALAVTNFTESYQQFGPAAEMHVNTPDGQHGQPFLVFQNFPGFDARRGGEQIVDLLGISQRYYTGLQVAKDPGVWVVWLGCFMMVFGSMAAFFLSHRRIWVTLTPDGGQTGIKVGGSAHRNQPAFEIYFEEFKQKLKEDLNR